MHRIAATPGGWNPDTDGVILIEQTPGAIAILTAADTDIQTLAAAADRLPGDFPSLRVANLLHLQQQLSIDTYAEQVLASAKAIALRLLGGRAYWSYGLEVVKETASETGAALFVLPGDDRPDPTLLSQSTVSLAAANQLWRYFCEGGTENAIAALQFLADTSLGTHYSPPSPQPVPEVGLYAGNWSQTLPERERSRVGILFYRAHYLAGNTAPIERLCEELVARNLDPVPVYVTSLGNPETRSEVLNYFQPRDRSPVSLIINTTSFSLAKIGDEQRTDFWQQLNVPVLQAIFSGGTREQWEMGMQGLSPRDVAMNVALPEVDGRLITRAISFKSVRTRSDRLETDVVAYESQSDRVAFVAELAANWVHLAQTSPSDRRIALILANYPNRDGRLANGVGLDTPASCVAILQALQAAGYAIAEIPEDGDRLIALLTSGVTNDPEGNNSRRVYQHLSLETYRQQFASLPQIAREKICDRWGKPESDFAIAGVQLGNIFLGIQPSRGYDRDPSLNYHSPDLEPPHDYLAFYIWLRECFGAQAIVHLGKHGNLEWLPGKSIALSADCYPEIALGAMPHLYPFIVNDPGEGAQAKRRSQAAILDHLTPPMTRAELYGSLQQLEALIDEYYEAQSLDPSRLPAIGDRIANLVREQNLHVDLGLETIKRETLAEFLTVADGYLCELKEAQIRDGLHIFGACPQGTQLRDLIVAIARPPAPNRLGLTRAIAADLALDCDPLTDETNQPLSPKDRQKLASLGAIAQEQPLVILGDAIALLETLAAEWVAEILHDSTPTSPIAFPHAQTELNWIRDRLLPTLQQTPQEIANLLRGLDGKYIPSGAAGAPTRGRPEVLPTGRNFYSVDIRGIPTETAWGVGRKAAATLVERYTQENGDYPRTLAISVWGTSTMRTGGDDIAEALALLGVQPIWDGISRRVIDFEILPLSVLERPRIDVTLRVSGFFRDGFPNLIHLFNQVVAAVASLNEPPEQNPLVENVRRETQLWQVQGLTTPEAEARSLYRVFGSKPGAYGAGLQGLIEAQNWQDDSDLARAYINWSSYAYAIAPSGNISGTSAPGAFEQRLAGMDVVLQNQDNREHDLLDSDDYYQFQGGLTAAVRAIKGENPTTYFGDNSVVERPRVRELREEIARVYRSRVVNPKWLEGVKRHGYKGAFEMAATVDYLFAYDATANCVEDHMYAGVAEAYLLAEDVQQFVCDKNPWALRDMAERLLEANLRGLWRSPPAAMLEKLRDLTNYAEGIIEERT